MASMMSAHASSILLADVGGTHSRFALNGPSGRPEHIRIIDNDEVASLEAAIARYLDEGGARPRAAVLAVASPIDGNEEIALTNRAWRFRPGELMERFGFSPLRVVNDFEAIAWALSRLTDADAHPLGPPMVSRSGVKAVLGPGTGLGVAALVPANGHLIVLPSEGGHASFGPQAADEAEVFAQLVREHGPVSGEMVLSGPGLERLMRALDAQTKHHTPEAVVAAALAGEASAQTAARLFVRLLGRFAGDVALTFKAFGGVYIAGGVASRLSALLDPADFRRAFEAHAPYQQLLAEVPTFLMSRSEPGLLGCAALADEILLPDSQ
jgi:glucokinase